MNRVPALVTSASKACLRRLSTTEVKCRKPDLTKIKQKQELFQQDNGVPIHLKGGPGDYILYYVTVGLTVFAFGSSLHSIYLLANSK